MVAAKAKDAPAATRKEATRAKKTTQPRAKKKQGSPYPEWRAPSPKACERATLALESLHGPVAAGVYPAWDGNKERHNCGDVASVIESLIRTILSQNTTNKNSTAAFASLWRTFGGDFERVRRAKPERVADSIRTGGLGQVKGARIQALLNDIVRTRGTLSLEYLRELQDEDAKDALMAFDGVGPKTASCVLLFCLGRHSFAVDTHVHRIAMSLGWIPPKATREQAHAHLDARVPNHLKYRLHVLLVRHGKCCPDCAANGRPQRRPLGPCPLGAIRRRRMGPLAVSGSTTRPPWVISS